MGDDGKQVETLNISSVEDIEAQGDSAYKVAAFLSFINSDPEILKDYINGCHDEALDLFVREEKALSAMETDPQAWREIDPLLLVNNSTFAQKVFHKDEKEEELDKKRQNLFTDPLMEFWNGEVLEREEYSIYSKLLLSLMYNKNITSGKVYEYIIYQIGKDRRVASEMLSKSGSILSILPEEYRDDKKMVEVAIRNNGEALEFASDEIKGDKDLVSIAIEENPRALQFVSKELKDDREVVLKAVSKYGLALKYASKQMQSCYEVVVEAITRGAFEFHESALAYVSKEFLSNREIIRKAVQHNYHAMEYASAELKKDKAFVLELIHNYRIHPEHIDSSLYEDRDIALASVIKRGETFEYFPRFFGDKEIAMYAVKSLGGMYKFVSDALKEDIEVIKEAVKNDPEVYESLSVEMKNKKEVIICAIESNQMVWMDLSEEVQYDPDIMDTVFEYGCAEIYAVINRDYWNEKTVTSAMKKDLGVWYMLPEEWSEKPFVLKMMLENSEGFAGDYPFDRHQLKISMLAQAFVLRDPSNIRRIEDGVLADSFIRKLVKQKPEALWYIDEWSESLLLAAVSTGERKVIEIMEDDSTSGRVNDEVRQKIYVKAIKRNPELLRLIPDDYVGESLLLEILREDPKNIKFIRQRRITSEMVEYALKNDPSSVSFLPTEMLENPDFLISAININPKVRQFIPENRVKVATQKVMDGFRSL
ncbi:MAG: DUF4116 domain-containing protein [Candidatus Dojkabacteria bacterium]